MHRNQFQRSHDSRAERGYGCLLLLLATSPLESETMRGCSLVSLLAVVDYPELGYSIADECCDVGPDM
jgi:hypothetical protein